ncbi:hypothetical protein [Actinomadura hibisca]|uniref:hypothetical protein n=1 Tax=Actinomadura hibisca TaxID=68565 RepID=UPI000829BE4F|nr:hypothetical protein [Actinomadura hibisca]
MTDLRDSIATVPPWAYFLGTAVLTTLLAAQLTALLQPDPSLRAVFATGAAFGVLFAAAMTAVLVLMRRREQARIGHLSRGQLIDVTRALRTGEPAADPGLDTATLAQARHRRDQLHVARRRNPWLYGALAALGVLNAVLNDAPGWYLETALFLVLIVLTFVSTPRALARLDALETAVQARSPAA